MENTSVLAGLIFFLAFAGMILIHELGHFLAARLFKVEVEEFGFGLPPRALTFWRQKGYFLTRSGKRIQIPRDFGLPFGWSEVLERELTLTVDRVEDQLILRTMDIVKETKEKTRQSGALERGQILVDDHGEMVKPQADAGTRTQTLQIGKTRGQEQLVEVITEAHPGTEFTLNWLPIGGFVRPKGENDPNIPGGLAAASPWKRLGVLFAGPIMNLLTGFLIFLLLVRVDGYHDLSRVMLAEIVPNSPAASAGMLTGDVVLQAAGQPVTGFDSLSSIIQAHLEQPVEFVLQRGEQTLTVTATPRSKPPEGQGAIGIRMTEYVIPMETWGDSFRYAAVSVYDQVRALLLLPAKLIRGSLSPEEGRFIGLKGIYDIFNLTVSTDVESREPLASTQGSPVPTYSTLYLIATLTISIGLINLFPFPALDGGRIIFVLPELITRRRVPHQFENAIHAAGMILLLLLMLYINVMDFVNPIVHPRPLTMTTAFQSVIKILLEPGKPFPKKYLSLFSDIDPASLRPLLEAWPRISLTRKRTLLDELDALLDEDTIVSFDDLRPRPADGSRGARARGSHAPAGGVRGCEARPALRKDPRQRPRPRGARRSRAGAQPVRGPGRTGRDPRIRAAPRSRRRC